MESDSLIPRSARRAPCVWMIVLSVATVLFCAVAIVFVILFVFLKNRSPDGPLISAVQMSPFYNTYGENVDYIVQQNLELAVNALEKAAKQGSQLVVLPEGFTGWLLACLNNWPCPADTVEGYAEAVSVGTRCSDMPSGSQIGTVCGKATDMGLWVITTLIEKVETDGGTVYYNTAVVVGDDAVQHRYRKSHISGTGSFLSEPDTPDSLIFEYKGRTFGVLICADIQFPEPLGTYISEGVDVLVFTTSYSELVPFITALEMAQGFSVTAGTMLLTSNTIQQPNETEGVSRKGGGGLFINGEALNSWWVPAADGVYIQTAPVPPRRSPLRDAVPTDSIALAQSAQRPANATCRVLGTDMECFVLNSDAGSMELQATQILNFSSVALDPVAFAYGLSVRWELNASLSRNFALVPLAAALGGDEGSPDPYYALAASILYCPADGSAQYNCDLAFESDAAEQRALGKLEFEVSGLACESIGVVYPHAMFYGNPIVLPGRGSFNYQLVEDGGACTLRARLALDQQVSNAGLMAFGAL
eukprot:gnl/Chilomastix_cuspidata/6057.p1 GENE.gnl/Chilomastix_cuspidata/6057~~gnl/Chilomastix_cuspidata/6057.p1  ORF type:complete len:549 (+),score=88.52 gnl/Chilomastix_cuspidata/6057:54-1649(+)